MRLFLILILVSFFGLDAMSFSQNSKSDLSMTELRVQFNNSAEDTTRINLLFRMGYKYLEFGSTYGETPTQLKSFMDGIGLRPLAGGSSIGGMLGDGLQQHIDACLAMDKKYLICYWPWQNRLRPN